MAFSTPARPVKRKPATYGRPSARKSFGFESPDEDELAQSGPRPSGAGVAGPHQHGSEGPRTPSRLLGSSSAQTVQSSKLLSAKKPGSEPDPYDVPSSDNEDPLTSPNTHLGKKRKLPQKTVQRQPQQVPKMQSEVPKAIGAAGALDRSQKNISIRHKKGTDSPSRSVPSTAGGLSDTKPKQASARAKSTFAQNESVSLAPAWKPTKVRPREDAASSSSHASSPKRKRFQSAGLDESEGEFSLPGSSGQTQTTLEPRSSVTDPVTPPRSASARRADVSRAMISPSAHAALDFASPSTLDMPRLSIASSSQFQAIRSTHSSPGPTNLLSATYGRSKLKDRLTAKDGSASARASDHGNESDDDEDEMTGLTTYRYIAPEALSQDSTAPSSNLEKPSSDISKLAASAGPRQTYSARIRTLRRDEDEDDLLTGLALETEEGISQTSRRIRIEATLPATQNDGDDFDFPDADDEASSKLKNVHELREAGASARLVGETEAILEELESNNRATSRWGLLNLVLKLDNTSFWNSFLGAGLESRIFSKLGTETDLVSKILLAMAIIQLAHRNVPRYTLERYLEEAIELSEALLSETAYLTVIVRDRSLNVVKGLQQEFLSLCKIYTKSPAWTHQEPEKLTPQLLSLQLLEKYTRKLREAGFRGEVLRTHTTADLMRILNDCEPALKEDGPEEEDLKMKLVLSLLESSSLSQVRRDGQDRTAHESSYVTDLARILSGAPEWRLDHQHETLGLMFRLCLNLTNNDSRACDQLATKDIVSAVALLIQQCFEELEAPSSSDPRPQKVDNLILALGLLINLAERSRQAQQCFLVQCERGFVPLHTLMDLFASRWQRAFEVTSEQESRTNVPMGYLTVLLTFLCAHETAKQMVASRLEGGTLHHLLVAAEEFLSYNKKVTEEIQSSEDGADLKALFLGRLESLIKELKLDLPPRG